MPDNILFYIVFISQIFLVSYYFPSKILQNFKRAITQYPPEKYPKLYMKSADYYQLGATIYRILNHIIILIGLVILFSIAYEDYSNNYEIESGFAAIYFFVQMIPAFLMEISSFSYYKQMRKANVKTTRTAVINQRHLFDFVSAKLVALAVITNVGCFLFFLYLEPFEINVKSDSFVILMTLILSNLLYAVIIRFNINGKKLDPHQDSSDRLRQTKITVSTLVIMSIVASVFLAVNEGINRFELDHLKAVFMSFYLQLIAAMSLASTLKVGNVDKINFDVYRDKSELNEAPDASTH